MGKKLRCVCDTCDQKFCVSRVPFFSNLSPEQIRILSSCIVQRKFFRDEFIMSEGESEECLVIIHRGQAKAFKNTYDGKETILYIFSTGDFFGEKNILSDQKASYSVTALEDCDVCLIQKETFRMICAKHPVIAFQIMKTLTERIEYLENTIHRSQQDVGERLKEVLIEFAQKYGKAHPNGILVTLPMNREGIASYIGVSRETVSRKISSLENEGVIQIMGNKKLLILDRLSLAKQQAI